MNSNRGQYTSAPLNNMKNKRPDAAFSAGEGKPQTAARPRRFGLLALMLSAVLPVLFLLALLISAPLLRWAFLIAAGLSVAAMWLLRAFVRNARGTLTVVYCALAVVIALSLFMDQAPEARKASSRVADSGALFSDQVAPGALSALLNDGAATEAPTSAPSISAAQQQLEAFFYSWAENDIPAMLQLCAPAWVAQQQAPSERLWQLMSQRHPLQYQVENVQGSEADTTRTITLKVSMAKEGHTEAELVRMQVLMFRVTDVWYVDPQSLGGTPIDEAAEAEKQQQQAQIVGTTIAPTATPNADANAQVLYYNSNGGKYYHSMPNCPAVDERYWPLDKFYYSDLNTAKFKNLLRCTKCNAPERP